MIKGIIFDLDGTIINSLEDICDATNRVLKENGFDTHPLESYKYFVGDGAKNLVIRALPEAKRTEKIIEKCYKEYCDDYGTNYLIKTKPYEGIKELLDTLKSNGIKISVVTNKPQDQTDKIIGKLFDENVFTTVIGKSKMPLKPDPTSTNYVMNIMNLAPEQCLFVGDSNVDIHTGKNAGCKTVGCNWGFRGEKELSQAGADYIAYKAEDILKFIKNK